MRVPPIKKWPLKVAEGRWCGFGPYYAMFPVDFARRVVHRFCPTDGSVLDPFCGRGTAPFVAQATGRHALGSDVNPVAWVFAKTKTDPHPDLPTLLTRVDEVGANVQQGDEEPENEFQAHAWNPQVLGFLKAARRSLDWRESRLDRTLMGVILVYLHAKRGNGISNQMRQSKAMSPDYSVRWWQAHNLQPPALDPIGYFKQRAQWRYKSGIVAGPTADIRLGDASEVLEAVGDREFNLLLTSPPYCGVTNYKLDNWIRLWMLGGAALPEYETSQKFCNHSKYTAMIRSVFTKSKRLTADDAVVYVRTHTKPQSKDITLKIISELWPDHSIFTRSERPINTQTKLFGDHSPKPGETDILAYPAGAYPPPYGFMPVRELAAIS